jgi:uncharacterized membrane protein
VVTNLFAKPLLINGCRIFAYVIVLASNGSIGYNTKGIASGNKKLESHRNTSSNVAEDIPEINVNIKII